ncbi:hypothetical protein PG997_005549 [Apiospora hydei]|uniref:Uncharacterized protein n=1 Tax=Apiospora hydei TaxID=1337664 RepID=A0ABR1WLF6_9PEZI
MASYLRGVLGLAPASMKPSPKYESLRGEGSEPLLDEKGDEVLEAKEPSPWYRQWSTGAFALSLILFIVSVAYYGRKLSAVASDNVCQRRMWPGHPVQMVLDWEWRQYDSDIIPDELFGDGITGERIETWKALYDFGIFQDGAVGFELNKLPRINKSLDEAWWTRPPPFNDEVLSVMEVTHQLHCTTWIYRYIYRLQWDSATDMNITDLVFQLHANHCFISLFTMVQCQADMTPVLFQRDSSGLGAWKTRDAPHRCKQYERMTEWQKKNQICTLQCSEDDVLPGGAWESAPRDKFYWDSISH